MDAETYGYLSAINNKLDYLIGFLQKEKDAVSTQLDALTVQVAANVSAEQSAITLIQGLAAEIAAHANDPAAITALSNQLQASAQALAAAVTANTPAAPPAPAPAP
jgi:hypothetical protein